MPAAPDAAVEIASVSPNEEAEEEHEADVDEALDDREAAPWIPLLLVDASELEAAEVFESASESVESECSSSDWWWPSQISLAFLPAGTASSLLAAPPAKWPLPRNKSTGSEEQFEPLEVVEAAASLWPLVQRRATATGGVSCD